MVSARGLSVVDRGFEPQYDQTKAYTIGFWCFSSTHAVLRRKSKDRGLEIKIMCPSGATCLPVDCCFIKLELKHSNQA